MADKSQSPATKEDVKGIMGYLVRNDGRTSSLEKRMDNMEQKMDALEQKMERDKKEIIHEFHIVAEDIKHNFQGAFHDKLEQHGDRILRIERRVGLVA